MNKVTKTTVTTSSDKRHTPWEYTMLVKNNRIKNSRKSEKFQEVLEKEILKLTGKDRKDGED